MGGYLSIFIDYIIDCWKYIFYGKQKYNQRERLPIWSRVSIDDDDPFQTVAINVNKLTTTTTTNNNDMINNSKEQSLKYISLIQINNHISDYNTFNNNNNDNNNEFIKHYKLLEQYISNRYYKCQRKCDEQEFLCKIIRNYNNNENKSNDIIINDNNNNNNNNNNNEIKIVKLLNHPNIIKLEDLHEYNNNIYMVFENINGGELFRYIIERGSITEEEGSIIIRKMTSAIAYLHSLDIVHRDIKAESFLLTSKDSNWDIKLTDFGCSKELMNITNSFVGSKGYISPEVLQKNYHDKAIDMWSLGIISYLLLCGCFPFDCNNTKIASTSEARKLFQLRFPFWSNNLSASAKDLLHNLLEVDPKSRYNVNQVLQHPWITGRSILKDNTLKSSIYLAEFNIDVFRKPLNPYLTDKKRRDILRKI